MNFFHPYSLAKEKIKTEQMIKLKRKIQKNSKTKQMIKLNSNEYHNLMILQVEYFFHPYSVSNLYKYNLTR